MALRLSTVEMLAEPPACNTTNFHPEALDSELSSVFRRLAQLPGWFNVDDCAHFSLILGMQSLLGLPGDLFEIGSYHGRSTCILARGLRPGERLHVCDPFDLGVEEQYGDAPTVARLMANLHSVLPGLDDAQIVTYRSASEHLRLEPAQRFRFVHVDGAHAHAVCLQDLRLSARHLLPFGVIAVDDYAYPQYPGVTFAVRDFLTEHPHYEVLADLNRHGAGGRKLYLTSRA
jgi:predicted O-methyltransferase YrrM